MLEPKTKLEKKDKREGKRIKNEKKNIEKYAKSLLNGIEKNLKVEKREIGNRKRSCDYK